MAKLSEIYKVGMSVNDIPRTTNTVKETNGGGQSAPATFTSGKKLSEYYTVGMEPPKSKAVPTLPTPSTIAPSVPDISTETSQNNNGGLLNTIKNLFSSSTPSLPKVGQTNSSVLMDKAKAKIDTQNYQQNIRNKELADFDAKDKSEVFYTGKNGNNITRDKLNLWLQPDYQLSKDEKKQIKELVKETTNVKNFQKYFGGMDTKTAADLQQNISRLEQRTSGALGYGVAEAIPGVKAVENMAVKAIDKANGNTENSEKFKADQTATQNTTAYKVGRAGSKMLQYYGLNKSGVLNPLNDKLGKALIPKLGETLGGHVANILSDEVADVILDTVPEMTDNIIEGKNAKKVAGDVVKNLGENLAYNVGGEYIPEIIKAFKSKGVKEAVEDATKEAMEQIPDLAKNVEVSKATDEIATVAKNTTPEKNLVMAEDIGLNKNTDALFDAEKNIPELKAVDETEPLVAKGYAEPSGDTITEGYRERGYAQHVRGEDTPMKVEGLSKEVIDDFKEDKRMYKTLKNADTKALADEIYSSGDKAIKIGDEVYSGSVENKFRKLLAEKEPAALPLGHQLAKDYQKAGNYDMAVSIIDDMSEALTKSGQFSQAAVISMMKNDPLTALQYAKKQINAINAKGAKDFGDKWVNFKLTDDEIKAFDSIEPGNADAIKALYDEIGARLGKEYPTTFMEKLLEGRKIAMLFNVRTNVRNLGANVPMVGLRWTADRVEALGQNIAHLINPNFKVTQAVTGSGVNGRKLAKEVFESSRVQDLLNADVGKYELPSIKNALMKDKQMYKGTAVEKWINKMTNGGIEKVNEKLFGKKGVESLAETLRNTTYKALDLGDQPFVKENFIERLGSYINAQGLKSIDEIPDDAIELAWEEAMKATYKDESWAVKMLRGIKGGIERVPVVGKPLSQSAIPFLQAPGNIAARMVDYSPINAGKGLGQIIVGATKKNEDMVRKGIESASKGLTGTGMILLGMKLKESGLITGDYAKDKDEKNFQKANGFKPWALHIGDKYLTYDWAQPAAQNLMVGTLVQEAIDNSDKEDASILKALGYEGPKAAINSWFDASPLQGLADLMKSNSYSGETDIAQNVIDSATSDFAGAFVPSLVNAIAKTNDTTQRNYYDPSSKWNTFVNQQKAKIPGLSETLPAKYDTWGREIKYADSTGEAFAQRFLVPGDYGEETYDSVNNEINRLYEKTSNAAVFPTTAPNKVGDRTLTNKEVSKYQKDMGERNRKLVYSLINSSFYKSLDNDSKAEMLKQIYGTSKLITERNLFKKSVSDNSSYKKLIEAYDNSSGSAIAVIEYLEEKAEKKKEKEEKQKNKK